jgi:hypothetical protein
MCCCHCLETGGCQAKGHVVTGTLPPASNKGKQHAVAPGSPQGSHSSCSSCSSSPPAALTSTDLFADPRHVSQLTAVFIKHYATQHALEEQRWAANAECPENIEKAKSHVIIYAWQKVDFIPTPFLLTLTYCDRMMLRLLCLKFKVVSSGHILFSAQ